VFSVNVEAVGTLLKRNSTQNQENLTFSYKICCFTTYQTKNTSGGYNIKPILLTDKAFYNIYDPSIYDIYPLYNYVR